MDAIRLGLQLRALRIRRRWRQLDVALRAGVSRSVISAIERGEVAPIQIATLLGVATALDARLDLVLRWHGEGLDRLLDAAHARLVESVVLLLRSAGWEIRVEVSFAIGGERGSIDILAFHVSSGTLLVIEVKSVVPDVQGVLHGIDRKARLAARIAREQGWVVRGSVARLLVLPSTSTSRRRVATMATTFDVALPHRGSTIRRWIRDPVGPMSGILFLADAARGGASVTTTGVMRVRTRGRAAIDRQLTPRAANDSTNRSNVARGGR